MIQTVCKNRFPTAAALEYRLPVYPVSKAFPAKYSSPLGDIDRVVILRGVPRARHRDILDAIMISVTTIVADPIGRVHVVFDLAEVRKALRLCCASFDWTKLREYLLDLQATVIAIRRPGGEWPSSWPMLAVVGDAKTTATRQHHQFTGKLKKIVFSEGAAALLTNETRLYLNKAVVLQILALNHQVSRSVARWLVSHSRSQHPAINEVLSYVGACGGERQMREYRKQLRNDSPGLAGLGIEVDGERLHYQRNSGVFIEVPEKQRAESKSAVAEQENGLAEPKSGVNKEVLYKELATSRLGAGPSL